MRRPTISLPVAPPESAPETAIEELRRTTAEAFGQVWRDLLGLSPEATVSLSRTASPLGIEPTRVVIRSETGAVLDLGLRKKNGEAMWPLGELALSVSRENSSVNHPEPRRWLRSLAQFFGRPESARRAVAEQIESLHHSWATANVLEARDYRHVERAHSGTTALLRLGFRCNQDCHFCWEGRDWPDAPEALLMSWLDEIAEHGVKRLTVCGGEPTLFSSLPAVVERAHRVHRMTVHVNTNAIRLRDRAYARDLLSVGVSSLLVSLHSHDPAISDAMTRAPGTHRRTVEGLHTALEVGFAVVINCVVERSNVAALAQHARFVRSEFVEAHADNPVCMVNYSQPGAYYDPAIHRLESVPLDEVRPELEAAARILADAGVLLEITGTCGFPSCVAQNFPDLVPWRSVTAMDAHHTSARADSVSTCARCAVRDVCVGVRREYIEHWGERGLVPFASVPSSDWYERLRSSRLASLWGA